MSNKNHGANSSSGELKANPKRYSSGSFIVSIPGILKICSIILFLASSIIFLSTPICSGTPAWYPTLYPISSTAVGVTVAVIYALYVTGIVRKGFSIWNLIDLGVNVSSFVLMFVVSVLTTVSCNNSSSSTQYVPGPMGIIGSVVLAASETVWMIQSRTTKEVVLEQDPNVSPISAMNYRKSVMV